MRPPAVDMILPEPTDAFDGYRPIEREPGLDSMATVLPQESFAVRPQAPVPAPMVEAQRPEDDRPSAAPFDAPPAREAVAAPQSPALEMAVTAEQQAAMEARSCTAAQLRRFIKSRPYVPMHELRRRFELNGNADEVTAVDTSIGTIYVGLPPRESQFIGDLVNQGDVGVELCRDPVVPIVMGVFAMRLISRPG